MENDRKVTVMQCSCGYPRCLDYWLVGLGRFVQSSGFTKDEAEKIARLWNAEELEPAA
jgi:hypothetical protein